MQLYHRRQRLRELAEAEAAGKTLWTERFDASSRTRIRAAVELTVGSIYASPGYLGRPADNFASAVSMMLKSELGIELEWQLYASLDFYLASQCSDDGLPSVIEAMVYQSKRLGAGYELEDAVNLILSEHRISFELINGQMIGFDSKELHQEVVAPVLCLLSGRTGWEKVESAYQDSLREISDGHGADAITDAGTALQEALMHLGCEGNQLGVLIKSAQKKRLLAPHDPTLAAGIERIMDWVAADRSQSGDSHRSTIATREDAWFTVHVVGALVLRLAGGARGSVGLPDGSTKRARLS